MSGFSRKTAASLLGHAFGKTEFAKPAKVYLALLTVVPTNATLGSELTEASGATGYARKEVAAASIAAAEEAAKSKIKTSADVVFNAITAGSATVIAWALCDSATEKAGNVIMWGTCTSTVISSTQTPPTVEKEKLVGELE